LKEYCLFFISFMYMYVIVALAQEHWAIGLPPKTTKTFMHSKTSSIVVGWQEWPEAFEQM